MCTFDELGRRELVSGLVGVLHGANRLLVGDHENEVKLGALERFGWQPYPQKHFESRFTKFYESYWLPKRFGYDVRLVQYSSLILTGQMTRKEAIELLKKPSWDEATIHQEFEFVANKLGISSNELNKLMELPKKTYKDYL